MSAARFVVPSLFPEIVADKYVGPLPMSVQAGTNADLVHKFRDVYFSEGRSIVDLTYGNAGGWWTKYRPAGLEVSTYDFTDLPYGDGSFQTVCYDPPYVQTGGKSNSAKVVGFRDRFGINETGRTSDDLFALILAGCTEAARITDRNDGFLCVKAMDFVGSARFCDWTYEVRNHLVSLGMHLHDEVIHNAGPGPGGHNISVPKRARRAHSKLLVFTWRAI